MYQVFRVFGVNVYFFFVKKSFAFAVSLPLPDFQSLDRIFCKIQACSPSGEEGERQPLFSALRPRHQMCMLSLPSCGDHTRSHQLLG